MIALVKPDNLLAMPTPQGKSNEWYTPARYIEAARQVMGSIDLDPASCELANETVKATHYYTEQEDGLARSWHGNAWLNPPYSGDNSQPGNLKSGIRKWVDKLVEEYERGNILQAIALLPNRADVIWFHQLWVYSLCFLDHSIRFYVPLGRCAKSDPSKAGRKTNSHIFGSIFVYLGTNEQKFTNTFSQFGTIAKRVSPPKSAPSTLWEVAAWL